MSYRSDADRKQARALRDAKAGSPKGASGTYNDRREEPSRGVASIRANFENKPATPRPKGATADLPNV